MGRLYSNLFPFALYYVIDSCPISKSPAFFIKCICDTQSDFPSTLCPARCDGPALLEKSAKTEICQQSKLMSVQALLYAHGES